jgi:NAD(P)-dependent dehydrogenase (short-subunit alcohol dehydrogenase family)
MTTSLTILTGASRGLGRAMAAQLLDRGGHLLTLQRRPDASLDAVAREHGATLEQWATDLAAPADVNGLLGAWLSEFASRHAQGMPARVNLVHNAALLSQPGPIDEASPSELSQALRVGLEAPVLLTATVLRLTAGWGADRRVLFISSGLGRRPMAGSAPYCAVKAGLDHFARALALDQAQAGGARVVSLAPGVIDTDMQVQLRSADRGAFPEGERFAQLKSGGALDTPEQAAAKVLRMLDRDDFGSNVTADVRDA